MKIIKHIICIVLALCLVLPFAACGGGEELEMPSWLDLDVDYVLTWEEIGDARSYEIKIVNTESGETSVETSRRASYSLSRLPAGVYKVSVRSVGGKKNNLYSEWSNEYEFDRDRESGLLYTPINNNTEYAVAKAGTATGEVLIENYYRGKPVTAISDAARLLLGKHDFAAFRSAGSRVTGVIIGENIRTIGSSAFYNCAALTSITIPDTVVSIGESIFQNCTALETVTLSASVTEISAYAFAH